MTTQKTPEEMYFKLKKLRSRQASKLQDSKRALVFSTTYVRINKDVIFVNNRDEREDV